MKTLQKIISIFLAFIFLVSSLGFTANKMVCLKSGKTKLSFVHVKNCCPEKKSTLPVFKSNCCDLTNTFFNLSDFQNRHQHHINKAGYFQSFFTISGSTSDKSCNSEKALFLFSGLPPPLSGRKLLSFISILII
jgi:hypothetical protein